MRKTYIIGFGFSLLAGLVRGAATPDAPPIANPMRLRLTETSLTETGSVSDCDFKVQTRGFGFTAVIPNGVGVSYTSLTTRGEGDSPMGPTLATLHHDYVDFSYTYGSKFLITAGAGMLLHGDYSLAAAQSITGSSAEGKSLFLGPGLSIDWFEAYWIYRRNWVRFGSTDEAKRTLQSKHFQLGLGVHFSL